LLLLPLYPPCARSISFAMQQRARAHSGLVRPLAGHSHVSWARRRDEGKKSFSHWGIITRVQRRKITYSFHTGGRGVETGTLQVTTEGTIPTGLSPSHWGHESWHGQLIVGSFLSVK
jgi:hypothetical protein